MNRAYRFRIYPTSEQETMICKTFGCVRFLFNQMLEERKIAYERDPVETGQPKQPKYRTPAAFKREYDWLRKVDSLALCNAELNLKSAFRHFFRNQGNGYPKFKSRKNPVQSYTTNNQKGTMDQQGLDAEGTNLGVRRLRQHPSKG